MVVKNDNAVKKFAQINLRLLSKGIFILNSKEIELISAFLDVKTPENFTITNQQEDIKVVCYYYAVTVTQN